MFEEVRCTIITVTFNNIGGLCRTLNSLRDLRSQSSFEHVIIDGGSSDGTATWARENKALASTTVVSEPDNGIYDAMNKGIRLAKGRYCIFVNAGDELIAPNRLLELLSFLDETDSPWLVGRCEIVSEHGAGLTVKPKSWVRYSWWRQTFLSYDVCHPAVVARTAELVSHSGFDTSYRIAADYKLFTALGRVAKPALTQDVLARFARGGVSDTEYRRSLMECHRARTETSPGVRRLRAVDYVWANALVVYVAAMRRLARG